MAVQSPVRDGFRAVLAAPAVVLAEIGWRWAFGALVCVAAIVAGVEWLDSIPVSERNLLLLRSMAPPLVADAIRHIFAGSGPRFMKVLLILGPSLALFWVFAVALGRGATIGRLLGREFASARCLRALLNLSFLRLGLGLVTISAFVGAAALVIRPADDNPATFGLALLVLWTAIASVWSTLNWVLSVAPIFAVRQNLGAFGAISETVNFSAKLYGALFATGLWFWLMRLSAVVATIVVSLIIAAALWNSSFIAANLALAFVALGYCAFADFLYIARLASYIEIAREPPPAAVPALPPSAVPTGLVGNGSLSPSAEALG
jgi:hypothetical protein